MVDIGKNVFRGAAHSLGQLAHFIGHHGKTAPGLTSARSFDGGVQRQQIGLLGHVLNQAGNRLDFDRLLRQLAHRAGKALHGLAHVVDMAGDVQQLAMRFTRQVQIVFGLPGNGAGFARHGFHIAGGGGAQAAHRFAQRALTLRMAGHLAAHLHQPGRFDSGVDGQLADAVDHVAQLALETIVAGGQLADFVVGVYRHVVRQIARALAVLIQQGDDLAQRGDSQVAQIPHPA